MNEGVQAIAAWIDGYTRNEREREHIARVERLVRLLAMTEVDAEVQSAMARYLQDLRDREALGGHDDDAA